MNEHIENIRRTAETGRTRAVKKQHSECVDLFQHILDQISYLEAENIDKGTNND